MAEEAADVFDSPELRADLAVMAVASRDESRAFADRAVCLARSAKRIPRELNDHRGGTPWTSFLREVAIARRITDRAAFAEISTASGLVDRLPRSLALLQDGRLPVAQGKVMAEETAHCDDATAMDVDGELAERACRLAAWKLRAAIKQHLLRLDADAAAAASARATAARSVEIFPLRDDQAGVTISGPAVAVAAWYAAIDAQARALRAAGDPRHLDALRFDLAMSPPPVPDPSASPDAAPRTPPTPDSDLEHPERFTDCRLRRPVQLLVHVPVETTLGLSNEPGWLDGVGWISAPQVRQLLPVAELRQVCVSRAGQVIDLADRVLRPPPTPEAARDALVRMATRAFSITDKTWRTEPEHDPSDALREFVVVRDRFCDGPTQARVAAGRADLDHKRPHPEGPTAAWNLQARSRRTHVLKHHGWTAVDTPTGTLWWSPAGQLVEVDRPTGVVPRHDLDGELPDPVLLHALEAELLRPLAPGEEPPVVLTLAASEDPPF